MGKARKLQALGCGPWARQRDGFSGTDSHLKTSLLLIRGGGGKGENTQGMAECQEGDADNSVEC